MNIFSELLKIKQFREEKAELEMRRAQDALDEAAAALHEARDALSECRATCQRRENAIYADICSKLVFLHDLNDVTIEIDNMKEEKRLRSEEVESAQTVRTSRSESLDRARESYRLAMRMREKFSELKDRADDEHETFLSHAEEMELEEVASRRRDSDALSGTPLYDEELA